MTPSLKIGDATVDGRVFAAPMTGVTDLPFRRLLSRLGAAYVATEMVACAELASGRPDVVRRAAVGAGLPLMVVQLVGRDATWLAKGARMAEAAGAEIIDLNMGCPAKKVCGRLCGSALLTDEALVARILESVVAAVSVPVTLKIRTGWDREHKNGVKIACIAEASGIAALAVHGRTRADFYEGDAEYATIRAIKQQVRIPVFANGDISSPEKARAVLDFTGADGVMIGRASHGAPWIFRAVNARLREGFAAPPLLRADVRDIILAHLDSLYSFYGEDSGVRIARKHLGWYCEQLLESPAQVRRELMAATTTSVQFADASRHFEDWVGRAAAA